MAVIPSCGGAVPIDQHLDLGILDLQVRGHADQLVDLLEPRLERERSLVERCQVRAVQRELVQALRLAPADADRRRVLDECRHARRSTFVFRMSSLTTASALRWRSFGPLPSGFRMMNTRPWLAEPCEPTEGRIDCDVRILQDDGVDLVLQRQDGLEGDALRPLGGRHELSRVVAREESLRDDAEEDDHEDQCERREPEHEGPSPHDPDQAPLVGVERGVEAGL